jgi:phosphate transport system substrate-binding protein
MKKMWLLGLWLLASLPAWAQVGAQVQGAGATFPSKVYERWAQSYQQHGGAKVVYKPTGSGDGIKQASARSVQFGGTDSPLPADELAKRKLVQIPMLVGGIVPVVHLPGVGENRLQLDGPLLADLMAGRITRWNDPRIAALNPGLALPALAVKRIVRADKSGTTDGFTRYLAQVSPTFKQEVGAGQLPPWPGDVEAADGNDGVAKTLKLREGGITYVSFDRVARDQLHGVKLRNAAGRFVAATEAGFRAAIADSDLHRKGDDLASVLDRPAVDAWPITLTSFVLVDAEPAQAELVGPALRFLYWCYMHGDDLTRGTGFAPLPIAVQSRLTARFATVKARDGKPLDYLVY